jgi:flagellar hook-basal body complex protein FliE
MSIAAIESVLQQMRVTSLQTGIAQPTAEAAEPGGFAAELRARSTTSARRRPRPTRQAEDFEMGKPGIALNDVMVDLQKANVAFQTGLQVRNRLVAAYQEVMNMPA